jgi:hypothetical protein
MEPASHIDSQSSTLRKEISGTSQVDLFVPTLTGQTTRNATLVYHDEVPSLRFEFPDLCIRVPGRFRFACHIYNMVE